MGSDRRRIISQSHNYHAVGRSKNIFFSSRAKSPMELRAPKDVANLAFIFGLTEQQGKDAVNATCHAVSRAAAGRKMGPFRVRSKRFKTPVKTLPLAVIPRMMMMNQTKFLKIGNQKSLRTAKVGVTTIVGIWRLI